VAPPTDQSSSDDEGFTKSTSLRNRRKQNKQQRATDTECELPKNC